MDMLKVKSSSIDKIGFDAVNNKMFIKFVNNFTIYTFCNVPHNIYEEFLFSPHNGSYGKHYRKYIFKRYDCY